ncbi:hypothetical protein L2E82_51634 [Cichorium intybus]|nr:hypothetical protein L2E82_51634 [Cichorium intybus]
MLPSWVCLLIQNRLVLMFKSYIFCHLILRMTYLDNQSKMHKVFVTWGQRSTMETRKMLTLYMSIMPYHRNVKRNHRCFPRSTPPSTIHQKEQPPWSTYNNYRLLCHGFYISQLLLEPILATSVYTGLENVQLEGGVSGKYVLHGGDYGGCRLYSQSWESRDVERFLITIALQGLILRYCYFKTGSRIWFYKAT